MTIRVRHRLLFVSLAISFLPMAGLRAADKVDHPIVPGFERFYTAEKADAARGGQLLLGELNCVSCHQSEQKGLGHKQAPVLDEVGGRVRVGYLKKFLRDPQAVKPGSSMPNLFVGDPDRDQKIEALVHFLGSTGALKQERFDPKNVAPGRDLYHKVGCVACHGSRNAAGEPETVLSSTVPLGDLKAKYSIASLSSFLDNPHKSRPSGRMPRLLSGKEPQEIATYLLQGIKVALPGGRGTTNYSYYEGNWDKLPDFDKLKPVAQGTGAAFDLAAARRANEYGLRFEGFLKSDRDGDLNFTLESDDGSRLYIDGKLVVDNDGIHPPTTKKGTVKLKKGVHKILVDFFQGGGGAELSIQVEAPGYGSHNLADIVAPTEAALEQKPPKVSNPDDEDALEIKPSLVEKGKTLFTTVGCANCHVLQMDKKPLASTLTPSPLAKLSVEKGCLSAAPAKGTPWYSLSSLQRKALAAAVTAPVSPARAPAELVTATLTTFNCYACHVRDKVGGPLEELNKQFQTTQPEMGDEGRVPPPLDLVGAKLNPAYLKQLLDKGAHDRPYMLTRMPGFDDANVGHLVEAFAGLDTLPKIPAVAFEQPFPRIKATARHLVGGQAFGCIKCHTFAGQKAEGVQGIDMVLMPQRLRRDWFHAYITDPPSIRPGTRMPAAFVKGKSVLPDILDGTAPTQIEALWLYLSDGAKAQLPVGASAQSIPLQPKDGAILYRNFIEGGGSRAIGVGYPEKVHLAFDANEMRLALLWQGAFIDAAKHWTDRGVGYQGPLGDNILRLHSGASFAVLAKADEVWPTAPPKQQGYRFGGYRLTADDRPTFLYSVGDVKVEDFPTPVEGKEPAMRRTLNLTAAKPLEGFYFRAAVGAKIESQANGWYLIDGTWKMKIDSAAPPEIRKSANQMELLVPVRFSSGKAEIVQTFKW